MRLHKFFGEVSMYAFRLRAAAVALVAGIGLAGCTTPYGYNGVSVGVGSGGYYGDYGYGGYPGYGYGYPQYGYGYNAGYPAYGYGYAPYYGWYDDFYYPGSGYYVYDRYRRPHRWTDAQRRYWESRRQQAMSSKEFRRQMEARAQNWDRFGAGPTAVTPQVQNQDGQRVRTERERAIRTDRANRTERIQRANRTDRVERANRTDKVQRVDRTERVERANRAERVERSRPERAQRSDRQSSREVRSSISNRGNSDRSSDSSKRED
jgi:hypothetical protein